MMMQDRFTEIYRQIKEEKNRDLERMIAILRSKAEKNPEIEGIILLLEQWLN
jgi:hypothetical protein